MRKRRRNRRMWSDPATDRDSLFGGGKERLSPTHPLLLLVSSVARHRRRPKNRKCDARTMRTLHENITVHLSLCQIADKAISVVHHQHQSVSRSNIAMPPIHPPTVFQYVPAIHPSIQKHKEREQRMGMWRSSTTVVTEYYVVCRHQEKGEDEEQQQPNKYTR